MEKETIRDGENGFPITMVHYSKLIPSESNNYSIDNIEHLAQAIILSGGVRQNLLARKKSDEEYELISGHRRRLAAKYIVEKLGHPEYAMLPVHIEKDSDLQAEVELILANCSARERSEWEKMMEVDRLTELMKAMQSGSEEEQERFRIVFGQEPGLGGRKLRKIVADKLGLSETKVANLNHINSSLGPELMERFQSGDIGVTVANEAASLTLEDQKTLSEKKEIHIADVADLKSVSDSDTEGIEDQQLPGQMNITDFPEVLPDLTGEECLQTFWDDLYESQRMLAVSGQFQELRDNLEAEYGKSYATGGNGEMIYYCSPHSLKFVKGDREISYTWSELVLDLIAFAGSPPDEEKGQAEEAAQEEETDDYAAGERKRLEAAGWYDKNILSKSISEKEEFFQVMKDHWLCSAPIYYASAYMELTALKEYMERHESLLDSDGQSSGDTWEQRAAGQEPLPRLTNNDQRREWLARYSDWPIWFEVPEADEVYYRYDLPDGSSLVICEYKCYLFWKEKYSDMDPEGTSIRYYILNPGYHHLDDCISSRSDMVAKLKEVKR